MIELAVAMGLVAILAVGVVAFSRSVLYSAESVTGRAMTSAMRQVLDTRGGEVSRIAPQYGDLTIPGAATLSFRKRQAVSAAACAYSAGNLTIDLAAAEVANLAVGDSVMVRVGQSTADSTDDSWSLGRLTSVTPAAGCSGRPTTLTAAVTPAVANAAIGVGATVRLWSTRTYTSALVSTDSGYALTETVNGANPTRLFAFYNSANVFTYFDAANATAATAAAVRKIHVAFTPYLFQARGRIPAMPENLEWAIRTDDNPVYAGTIPTVAVSGTVLPRCNTPGATNFGDKFNVCVFPVPGCMNATASNFNALATVDNGTCTPVCTAGLQTSSVTDCTQAGHPGTWTGTVTLSRTVYTNGSNFGACAAPSAWTVIGDSCVKPPVPGCMNATAANYNPLATVDNGTCTPVCTSSAQTSSTTDCTQAGLPGTWIGTVSLSRTIYTNSSNFGACAGPTAWSITGDSCIYVPVAISGCTDPAAPKNYNPLATLNDGTCYYSEYLNQIDYCQDTGNPSLGIYCHTIVDYHFRTGSGPWGGLNTYCDIDDWDGGSSGVATTQTSCPAKPWPPWQPWP